MSSTLIYFLTLSFSFLFHDVQSQLAGFGEIYDVCPYPIIKHSAIYRNESFIFIFPGKDKDANKDKKEALIFNPKKIHFTYHETFEFAPNDIEASQLTNTVCALDGDNVAIWWGKKATTFNLRTLTSTKLGSPTNNGGESSMACYTPTKDLWIIHKEAHKVFTYYYHRNNWVTQSISTSYDHKYSPCIFYGTILICAGGKTNAKIEYVDTSHYTYWTVADKEIGLGTYSQYYGATHVVIDHLWYLIGGKTASKTLTSDIWIVDLDNLIGEKNDILVKSQVSLIKPIYFTAAVYHPINNEILIFGGALNTDDDGTRSVETSSVEVSTL